MDNYFAAVPAERATVIDLVKREASEECPDSQFLCTELDRCVHDAVESLWDSRVKTFVPLLALRRVRSCIHAGTCDTDAF